MTAPRELRRALLVTLSVLVLLSPARAKGDSAPSVAVLETYGPGMAAASSAVTRQLYATLARLGYHTIPEAETTRLTARLGPRILLPVDLASIASASHADHAVQATLSASGERYVAVLTLVTQGRSAPRYANLAADAAGIEAAVDRLARSLLPPVSLDSGEHGAEQVKTWARLALQTEAAFGLSSNFFYNHFVGGRFDYGFTRDFALGAYVGYANLKGPEGRVNNVLPYIQLEYGLSISSASAILVPLRFGTGYLPKNGPFFRLAAGPSFPMGRGVRLGFDLVAPTFIIVHDRTVVSMDVAAEVSFEL
jgi:hypothetical protein